MNSRSKLSAFLLALALAASSFACHQTTVLASDSETPPATVKEVDLQLKVSTTGVWRTSESRTISAPAIGGGTLQIVTLDRSGAHVHTGFFFQAEDGIRDLTVTGVQTCALPI